MTLEDEKEKLNYSHKLEVRRIWLDKLLIAALIGLAGFIGNIIFEGYKSDLAKTQFLLEKRMDALKDLRVSFTKLSQYAFAEAYQQETVTPEVYAQEVSAFMAIINQWGFLFSDNLTQQLTHYEWVHQAIADPKFQITQEHWGFILDLAGSFDEVTRTALNVEILGTPPRSSSKYFKLHIWKSQDVLSKGTSKLFDDNYQKWRNEHPH